MSSEAATKKVFTGRKRRKQTAWTVRLADVVSARVIAFGGIGTIVSVSLVFISLFFVVAPLFYHAKLGPESESATPWSSESPIAVQVDEYETMGWALYRNGLLQVFGWHDGEVLEEKRLLEEGREITGLSETIGESEVALGLDDGTVIFGQLGFKTTFYDEKDLPEENRDLKSGGISRWDAGIVQKTPQGQYRLQQLATALLPPVKVADAAVRVLDHIPPSDGALGTKEYAISLYADGGPLKYCKASLKENAFTGATSLEVDTTDLPFESNAPAPFRLLISGRGDNVFVAWHDGELLRYDIRDLNNVAIVEETDLLPDEDARLTVCEFVLGRETMVCGDNRGGLNAWFKTRERKERATQDGWELTRVHVLPPHTAPVTCLSPSQRSRMIGVGYADGTVRVCHVTTEQLVIEKRVPDAATIDRMIIAPKENGLIAITPKKLWRATFNPAYPEATLASLFGAVWYEGYSAPVHQWQSSFATAAPEMKLGLAPLIFGTLKATFYTMLFGAPLALLAAIYTSEFMHSRVRAFVKPTIEMMASLPSVVLGFLAALVFAPIVEQAVPATLAAFVLVPFTYLLAAHLWQLVPHRRVLALQRYRLLFLTPPLCIGLLLASWSGPLVERFVFAGDVKRWLDGQIGSGIAGWLLLWIPFSAILATAFVTLYVNPILRSKADRWSRPQFALLSFVKFLIGVAVMLGFALAVSWLLNSIGWDPRGTYVDTYTQRNALVVGFVMGFAVIPIIYTIADDALNTVPNHLRSASLGCGATPWQTAVRIVVPTAMSGLFSAIMIGLGRAVGETMIVLMAAGNTPVVEWNVFNGFRTLSANIAVELPEAVQDSTHYRTLFLCALTLFVLTFFVNTIAEVVRLRFRRRAYQL